MRRANRRDSGATLVETAFVLAIIAVPVLVGILEFGLFFKNWLSASHAATEAVAAVTSLANDPAADIAGLEAIENAFVAADLNDINTVVIESAFGGIGTVYTYVEATSCGWSPCPDPDNLLSYSVPTWQPRNRDVTVGSADTVRVTIDLRHDWVTGFFGTSATITASAEGRVEPQRFAP